MIKFVAEIGQNHNGSLFLAEKLVDLCALPIYFEGEQIQGVDYVKFTKRDMTEELTIDEYNRPYINKNSFGDTYGKHREQLELGYEEHEYLYIYASKVNGLGFIETVCSFKALNGILNRFKPDYFKVASRDLENIELVVEIARTKIPIIISTGMTQEKRVFEIIDLIKKHNENLTVLHCVSDYPSHYEDLNLIYIESLIDHSKKVGFKVGYSDHTAGILAPSLASMFNIDMIEKHITLDRELKGTDHAGSLCVDGLRRCVRDIRNAEKSIGIREKIISDRVLKTREKLVRSVALNKDKKAGQTIVKEDIIYLSPQSDYFYEDIDKIIGKTLLVDKLSNTHLKRGDI